jgi:hypothetical protein
MRLGLKEKGSCRILETPNQDSDARKSDHLQSHTMMTGGSREKSLGMRVAPQPVEAWSQNGLSVATRGCQRGHVPVTSLRRVGACCVEMFPSRTRPGRPTKICAGDEVECIDDQLPFEPYELIADPDIRIINQPILYRYSWIPK